MHLHEYQAKKVLQQRGLPVPDFGIAASISEAKQVLQKLGLIKSVIKVQVHAGGRGKAGGVKIASSQEEALQFCKELIGMKMVNQQTGKEGVTCQKVLLTEAVSIKKEYYLSFLIDRHQACPILIASGEGGTEIEEIAEKSPEKILRIPFKETGLIRNYQLYELCTFLGWEKELAVEGKKIVQQLAQIFLQTDAALLEINPLIVDDNNHLQILDAKMSVDENALFRQAEMASFYDASQISHQEAAAKEYDLAYIAMDGEIGCMVNGAGLAMATMDMIQLAGGRAANFLDVGGGASKEKVAAGFRIILSDPKVKAILINIFGGIMNCETLAEGIIEAAKELKIHVPLIVRMEGTNVEKGRKIIESSSLSLSYSDHFEQAAEMAVKAAKSG